MKLYQGGCSYLYEPDIFVDTSLSKHFGENLININNCAGGSSNTQIFRKAVFSIMKNHFDFVIIGWSQYWRHDKTLLPEFNSDMDRMGLLGESYSDILYTSLKYEMIVPNEEFREHCKFEPQGTDDVIMYTIILQQLLKSRNIPHLFITMGENSPKTLNARLGWLDLIDSKNYYGNGSIFQKMNYSVILDFKSMHERQGYSTKWDSFGSLNNDGYVRDIGSHLTNNARDILADRILKYLLENNIID